MHIKNIIFIGFMGTGKTTVSTHMGAMLHRKVYEIDRMISDKAGMKTTEIFKQYGESYFRNLETQMLQQVQKCEGILISCGGGIVLCEENRKILKNGTVVLLTGTPDTVLKRIGESHERPLLEGHKEVPYIKKMMQERQDLYQSIADIVIETDYKSVQEVCEHIIQALKEGLYV
ncbi:MAG: shikimate kinase [Lachnospiraceae bacterium]